MQSDCAVLYCQVWPARLYQGSPPPYCVIRGTVLGNNLLDTMCVFIPSTNFVRNISHSKKNWPRRDKKKMCFGLLVKYPLFSDFNETWIFSTDFRKKYLQMKFYGNPSSGSWIVPFGRTDRHDEANKSNFAVLLTRLKVLLKSAWILLIVKHWNVMYVEFALHTDPLLLILNHPPFLR